MRFLKTTLFFFILIVNVSADGFIIFPNPYPTPLSVKYHNVTCSIDNGIASTTIDQVFINNQTDALANGRYVFPVPEGAVIDQFKIIINGESKTATVMSKDSARLFFLNAIKNSTQASLLEYTNTSAYTLEIGTVAAGESRRIQISYVEILKKNDGLSRYLYPLNTEKFSRQLIDSVSIVVKISNSSPVATVYSPSFPITIERQDEFNVTATYRSEKSRPDRDFDLYYKLSDDAISLQMFPYKKTGEDGYFLILLTPKLVQPTETEKPLPKDLVFTIDRSGSMSGTKIIQARDALRFCISRLMPGDYFNVVAFDDKISSNTDSLLAATSVNIINALTFTDTITARGATDIALGLQTSLSKIMTNVLPHYCIFLTDGQATSGITNIGLISSAINEANSSHTRIFSVGFGYDVNTVLIDKLSMDNGGYPLYCSPDQNIETVISELYKKIEIPVLTSPTLLFSSSIGVKDIIPEQVTDLFSGSQVVICGRYSGSGTGQLSLSGTMKNNKETINYSAEFPDSTTEYSFVPRLWATQKISSLMIKIKLQSLTKENLDPLVDSVKTLSLAYGIVTPYTSSLFLNNGSSALLAADLQTASGKSANSSSNYMQDMRQNSNASQTVIADTNSVSYLVAPQTNQLQNAGNKLFVYTSANVWKDVTLDTNQLSDTVYYGTEKYFELAAKNPEVLDFLTVGNQTAFNYSGKNYLVLDNRTTALIPGQSGNAIIRNKSGSLMVKTANKIVTFTLKSAVKNDFIDIYTINGIKRAHITFANPGSVILQTSKSDGHSAFVPGVYIAVCKSNGARFVERFSIR